MSSDKFQSNMNIYFFKSARFHVTWCFDFGRFSPTINPCKRCKLIKQNKKNFRKRYKDIFKLINIFIHKF